MPTPPFYTLVSSSQRNVGDPVYNFHIQSNNPMFWRENQYELQQVSLTNTLYTFDSSNNKVYFVENVGLATNTATITPGVYDSTTLPAQLKTQMDAASAATGNTRTYTITYSSSTMKLTVAGSAGTFKFTFATNTSNSAAQRLGWSTYNIAAVDDTLAASIVSPYIIDLAYPLTLAIQIDSMDPRVVDRYNPLCQAVIPFDSQTGEVMRYTPPIPPVFGCIDNIMNLHVRICDPNSSLDVRLQQDFSLLFCRRV
jgi:hypothetical protein